MKKRNKTDKKYFEGIVPDYRVNTSYEYPKLAHNVKNIRFPYDLIMTKNRKWNYMWSSNSLETILQEDAREVILERGESYKFLDSISGEILKEE